MAGSGRGATTEELLLRGQKSTNQLKALLANLLPAAEGDGGEECPAAVEALLSDISDSVSQALASLQLGASYGQQQLPVPPGQGYLNSGAGGGRRSASLQFGASYGQQQLPAPPGQGYLNSGAGGGRRSASRRDGVCRTIRLQHGDYDSYTWRKYGQKDILGAKFARSYFKCAHKSDLGCCSAKKQVQQSDADPSVLEVTYIGAHTCDQPSASRSVPGPISSGAQRTGVHLPPVVPVPTTLQTPEDHRATDVPTDMACTPSMEQEQASLFFVPSPACSQSELLSAEVPQLIAPGDPPVLMELKLIDRHIVVSDSVVPEL